MPPKDSRDPKGPKKPRLNWSEEDWTVLNEIVTNTKTKSGVAMTTLLANSNPKFNQKLSQ